MTQTIARPFDAAIAAAKQRDEAADQLRKERENAKATTDQLRKERADAKRAADAAAAEAAAIEREARAWRAKLVDFGRRFIDAVGDKATYYRWSWADCVKVKDYCEKMLVLSSRMDSITMPEISSRYATVVFDKFEYGLKLAAQHGLEIPEGFFIGQVLLAERKATEVAPEQSKPAVAKPLRIVKTRKAPVRSQRPAAAKTDEGQKPAITTPAKSRRTTKATATAKA